MPKGNDQWPWGFAKSRPVAQFTICGLAARGPAAQSRFPAEFLFNGKSIRGCASGACTC